MTENSTSIDPSYINSENEDWKYFKIGDEVEMIKENCLHVSEYKKEHLLKNKLIIKSIDDEQNGIIKRRETSVIGFSIPEFIESFFVFRFRRKNRGPVKLSEIL